MRLQLDDARPRFVGETTGRQRMTVAIQRARFVPGARKREDGATGGRPGMGRRMDFTAQPWIGRTTGRGRPAAGAVRAAASNHGAVERRRPNVVYLRLWRALRLESSFRETVR